MSEKLQSARKFMKASGVDALIIPMNDPHLSEYVASHWKGIEWISGFTGSAGTVVITAETAGLWTDSRYFIQAEKELKGSGISLQKLIIPHTPEYLDFIARQLPAGSVVGIDGRLISNFSLAKMKTRFEDAQITVNIDLDPLSAIWTDRPPLPSDELFEHPLEFAGKSCREKLEDIRKSLKSGGAGHHLLTALDDIAWTFNLRGSDVEYNPVFYAWSLISMEHATLFVQPEKVPAEVRDSLQAQGVVIRPYEEVSAALSNLPAGSRLLLDNKKTGAAFRKAISPQTTVLDGDSMPELMKAEKNPTELRNIRSVMERDGAALVKLYRWLEEVAGEPGITEARVASQLDDFRGLDDLYAGESFPAIAGFNGNGAIVHYRPDEETSSPIETSGMFLLDSGGQYMDGTTDITRTTCMDAPTKEQKFHFTLVLKGMIGISRLRFPRGATGAHIDILAREHLWRHGLNYGHGTGHGVGYFLNVHEGPQGISPALSGRGAVPLQPGMILSNEPGFYLEGAYGIRIENLVAVKNSEVGEDFLEFETLTLFPISTDLIERTLLTPNEIRWLNHYHEEVLARLSPHLDRDAQKWLEEQCRPLPV